MIVERWLPVPDWEDLYEVSDQGRVRSLDRVVTGRDGRTRRFRGKILKLGLNPQTGYLMVVLCRNACTQTRAVHDLVLRAFVGPPPAGSLCRHGPLGKLHNWRTNLQWGTPSENNYDTVRYGRHFHANSPTCKRKHLLVAPNLLASPKAVERGWRHCLACNNARSYINRTGSGDLDTLADEYYQRIMGIAA